MFVKAGLVVERSTTASGPKLFHVPTQGRYGTVHAHACWNANRHLHTDLPLRAFPRNSSRVRQKPLSSVRQVAYLTKLRITGFDGDCEYVFSPTV